MKNNNKLFEKCGNFEVAREAIRRGIFPYFRPIESAQDTEVLINGKKVIMIGSNSYLGLTTDKRVKKAAIEAVEKYGSGCAGSRFLNGTLDIHVKLEEKLARFMQKEAAVVFSTGFQTNLGAISTLVGKDDYVIIDRLDHASIIEGTRLSFGQTRKYRHNDMDDLERILGDIPNEAGKLIVVDGVFSMEGDLADLPGIVELAKKYGAQVMVDDAHGIGVMGTDGRGTAEHFGLQDEVDLVMGTFSKTLASLGGFIAGSETVIHYIKHLSRELIFSASIPPANVAAVDKALDIVIEEPERRARLWEITHKMKKGLEELGFDTGKSVTPIIPVFVRSNDGVFAMCMRLHEEGVFVNPVIEPAVPPDHALIRTSYMATHTDEELDRVLEAFEKVGKEFGLI
ncbi:MAG: pyridoxal phosphate-dependent aminotransferase family protein [Planctomycetota bacterium]